MVDQHEATRLISWAQTARQRGDLLLHLQFPVASLGQGESTWGAAGNEIYVDDSVGALLGEIERLGWFLQHVGYSFVGSGSTSSAKMFTTGQGVVNYGITYGHFTFRRVQTAAEAAQAPLDMPIADIPLGADAQPFTDATGAPSTLPALDEDDQSPAGY